MASRRTRTQRARAPSPSISVVHPVAPSPAPDVEDALAQRGIPRTSLDADASIGTALFRFPQRRGVLPEQARAFADTNEWVRAAINRLKDRVSRAERAIVPIDPTKPYSRRLQARMTWLIENPNPQLSSWRSFIEPVIEDILVLGRGGWEYVANWRTWPVALFPFNAEYMQVNPNWDGSKIGEPRYFWTPVPRQSIPLRNEEITLVIFNPSTHRVDGLSPLDTLQRSVEADAAASEYVRSLLQRYPPPGWLHLGTAGPKQVKAVANRLQTDILGHGGMLVTGNLGEVAFNSLHQGSSRDNELQAWGLYFARKICAVYGISPQEIGLTFDINRATGESQMDVSNESGYKGLLLLIQEYINREVVARFGVPEDLNLQFAFKVMTVRERIQQVELATKMTGGIPIAMFNEARKEAGMPPLALGNAIYVQTHSGPVAMIGDDADMYRRQVAAQVASTMDAQAAARGEPDPNPGTTPDTPPDPAPSPDDSDTAQAA